jgi:cysteine desulfurase family protein
VAKLLGLKDLERVIFTPNITWAINIALSGLGLQAGDHVLSTVLEHNSTARPLARLSVEKGILWERVPLNKEGFLTPQDFALRIRPNTRLVVLNHASNVTGNLFPAKAIKEAIGEIPLLLDTAQTAGAVPLEELGALVDIVTFTGHKGLLGPTGTGGLYIKEGIPFEPLAVGGSGSRSESLTHPDFMPDALEAGTLNTHGLAGLAAGVEYLLERGVLAIRTHELALANQFLEGIKEIPSVSLLGPGHGISERVATISLNLKGWSSSDLAQRLEADYGIMIRAGLHCAPLAHEALGTFPGGSARFSFGPFTTTAEVQEAVRALFNLSKLKGALE